uniref:Crumbs cell polarity complex component 1 n=1 Tax=Esox lucius TaxID=8010 RepID=A0A3P9AGK5_ESOLU
MMNMEFLRSATFRLLACALITYALVIGIDGLSTLKARSAVPTTNQCTPNPCYNRAICRSRDDGYLCFCVPGFQGEHCQIEVNECVSQPCRNGATCMDKVSGYTCLCNSGFTGSTCEIQIDECQSQPCLNSGSCHDYINHFSCNCMPGFQGDRCEINVDECQDQPCLNGALCIDGVNGYSCDCSLTAFTGQHCETPSPQCTSQPCLNSATCLEDYGNYKCDCLPGFKGRQCEVDVSECSSSPCMYGGACIELSWQSLYGSEPLLPDHYDPQHATGFICHCNSGTTGTLCEEIVEACDPNPCENGGQCESIVGGYVCHCSQQSQDEFLYVGQNCSEALLGCEGHKCQNKGSCSPFLIDGYHGYSCLCTPGHTGPLCQTSTAFSFEQRGYLLLQSPTVATEAHCNITLSFRTVLPRAMLFQRISGGIVLVLELLDGQLRLNMWREASGGGGAKRESLQLSQTLELPVNVTDGEWYSVEALLGDGLLSLRLLDGGICWEQECQRKALVEGTLPGAETQESPVQTTSIGGVVEADGVTNQAFIGCLRDVFVDSRLVDPGLWLSDLAVNVTPGCNHRDRCQDRPCQNRGQCINQWQSYQCRCPRPYDGPDCTEEYVSGRFGNEDSQSYAVFTITDDPGSDITISFFLRTRRHTGILLVIANSTSQYLRLWLDEGRIKVQLHNFETLTSERVVNNGEIHFVSVVVDHEHMDLYVANRKQGRAEVRMIDSQMGDVVYVGGLAELKASSAFGGYFKGCIQDLRINAERLQFFMLDARVTSYPLELMANVTAGCTGDDSCISNPCQNGGMCYSVWDDFTCTCPPNTAGRRCEEVKWCELSPCPTEAECHTLIQGYECFANATFLDNSSVLSYRGNGHIRRSLTSISLAVRTRKRHTSLLHAERGLEFVTVSVQDGLLVLELQSRAAEGEGSSTVSLSSRRLVSDGVWHKVHLFMVTPWAEVSRWTLVLDEDTEDARTSGNEGGNLDFLREEVDILLGGLGPKDGWSLVGCMSTVEVGGIALPYYSPSEVKLPRTQEEQFLLMSSSEPRSGCSGGTVCEPNPCLNGASCQDKWNLFSCSCEEGWTGRRCEVNANMCTSNPCVHGNCSIQGPAYECACEFGYTGVDCEEVVDVCENHLCAHGATCLHGVGRYACLCTENYTGPYCSDRIEEIPWYLVVNRKIKTKLPVSICGDENRNYTCFNAGNCTERDLSCDCLSGFTGHRCGIRIWKLLLQTHNMRSKELPMQVKQAILRLQKNALLTSEGQISNLLLSVSLVSVLLLLVLVSTSVGLLMALNRRATHGTYSPSRQEKEGSRVEMWDIAQPPPVERLI